MNIEKRNIHDLDGEVCPVCGQALGKGFCLNGEFREAPFVPQQHSYAMACFQCRITWSVGANADMNFYNPVS